MALTKQERLGYIRSIKSLDPDEKVLKVSEDFTVFQYSNDITVNETLSTPVKDEELVRGLLVVALNKKYNYPLKRIELEKRVLLAGSSGKSQFSTENDIIVKNLEDDNPFLFFEVKSPTKFRPEMNKDIKDQLFMPAISVNYFQNSKYLVYATVLPPENETHLPIRIISIKFDKYKSFSTGKQAFNKWIEDKKPIVFTDIPVNYGKPEISLLVKGGEYDLGIDLTFREIKNNWKTIWDKIWGGTVEDNNKFQEFNKLLIAKIYDEKEKNTGEIYDFQIKYFYGQKQTPNQVFSDIDRLYKQAFKKYLGKKDVPNTQIIGLDNKVLNENIISELVEILCNVSLTGNIYKNIDILAEFYETVIRDAFKQTKGLYLTRPNLVLTIVAGLNLDEVIDHTLSEGNNNDYRFRLPFILDPSCGTGTFLIWMMKYITDYIQNNRNRLEMINNEAKGFIRNNLSESAPNLWARDYTYGIEKESMLATAAQINMILHGDGSTNIFSTDGLYSFSDYRNTLGTIGANNLLLQETKRKAEKIYSKDTLEVFDVIVSNPPFSASFEKNGEIPNIYELSGDTETLFFERWYQLLKPKGRLGVVLPEAFFSVKDYKGNRLFLYRHFNLKAIVSLPNTAFSPHTTTLTSLLLAQKKTVDEERAFIDLWERFAKEFDEKFQSISVEIGKISKKYEAQIHVPDKLMEIHKKSDDIFGINVTFPVFSDEIINDVEEWGKIRNKVKKAIKDVREWYLMNKVSEELDYNFLNMQVKEIGYKQGKKGCKDRPNHLFIGRQRGGREKKKILNIQTSTINLEIDYSDTNTIVGALRSYVKWDL